MDDEKYYEIVAREIRENRINDALWTKAIAKSLGDDNKTKAVYIQLRVDQLMKQERQDQAEHTLPEIEDPWADDEAGEPNAFERWKPMLVSVGQIVIFVVGLYAIWKWLWPWVRNFRNQL